MARVPPKAASTSSVWWRKSLPSGNQDSGSRTTSTRVAIHDAAVATAIAITTMPVLCRCEAAAIRCKARPGMYPAGRRGGSGSVSAIGNIVMLTRNAASTPKAAVTANSRIGCSSLTRSDSKPSAVVAVVNQQGFSSWEKLVRIAWVRLSPDAACVL